MTLAKAMRLS